jgi:outer membrane biosynthesis protein TonB
MLAFAQGEASAFDELLTFLAQMSPSRIQLQEPEIRCQAERKRNHLIPKYPEEARRNGIQGDVRIHIVVARDGSAKRLKVRKLR